MRDVKWFKVISVLVLLVAVSGVLIGIYSRYSAALDDEEKRLFQAVYTNPDIIWAVGTVKDAAFAYGLQRMGKADKADKHWTRTKNGETVEGRARLNIGGDKAWGRAVILYTYIPAKGDFHVNKVEFEQVEAYTSGKE